jgi:hypothetical protein
MSSTTCFTTRRAIRGGTVDFTVLTQIAVIDQARPGNVYSRPDGH